MLSFHKIGHRIIITVGLVVAVGLAGMVLFYANEQEQNIMAQNERTIRKVTESVSQTLQTVMLAGYADIAQAFAESLKSVPDIHDFRIMRRDGSEAFRDTKPSKRSTKGVERKIFSRATKSLSSPFCRRKTYLWSSPYAV